MKSISLQVSRILAITFGFAVFLSVSIDLHADSYNATLKIGDEAPAWKDLPGVDDKTHSLDDFNSHEILVVIFTCNSCPVATDYEDRLCTFAEKYADNDSKVGVVAINVNKIKEDQLPAMKKRAASKRFPFPYLYDESQKIAKDFGAVFTPEVYVLNRERKVIYMGAIDDHSDPTLAKRHYLVEAVEAGLSGKRLVDQEIVPIGCRIRYARERRK